MGTPHPDIGPELRRLAQLILDRLDPAVRAAASAHTGHHTCWQRPAPPRPSVANGEQHPLLTVIADHSVALLAVIRGMVTDPDVTEPGVSDPDAPGPGAAGPGVTGPGAPGPGVTGPGVSDGRYHGIPIVVEPLTVED